MPATLSVDVNSKQRQSILGRGREDPFTFGARAEDHTHSMAGFRFCSALLLMFALTSSAHAAEAGPPVNVLDGWRFRWGDSPVGSDGTPLWAKETGDSKEWRTTPALAAPEGRGDHKFMWLSIPIPDGGWTDPALYLGEITHALEVYADGQHIYTSGKIRPDSYEIGENLSWHIVPLPRDAQGKRVLLRIQSSNPNIGVAQAAQVGSKYDLLVYVTRQGQAPFVICCLLLAVALGAGGAFALHWRRRMLAGLAVSAASGGLILLGLSGMPTALWGSSAAATLGTTMGIFLLVAGLMEFVSDALLDNRRGWFQKAAMVFSPVAGVCALATLLDLGIGQRILVPFLPMAMVVLLVVLSVAITQAWLGNPDARLFVGGFAGLVLSIVLTILPVIGLVGWSLGNVTHWGYVALTLSLLGIVTRRSIMVVRTLEAHTHQLEARAQEVRNLAERMGNGAGELATVVQQLRSSSDEQTEGVSRQAVALQEAEQTVKEIRRSSQMTAEKASALAASAESAEQVGREGTAALERTLSDLAAIRTEVSDMARRIFALDERTREVSGIVDSVKDLADQSNMLAINAAIEAARSGESGRGFGVVAREMRGLADQSIQATHRIREVLDGVSNSMREAARSSEKGDERVRLSLDAVRTSSAQFQQLADIIGDTSSSVRQITAAVSAQDAGTHQMAQAIQELSGQMQRTLKTVQETQEATRSVQSLAESMSGMASQTLKAEGLSVPAAQAQAR
ncbi:methyl-accepting chemotaxis protein (MCP) signaling domain [Myxococcus xanthus DK 1622]|uniref:Methyl-accepting chemotaxis protein (MCP) signaling domain n=2 Tax=Myxococcus xanthus TaxID=34 RepID=Q1D6S3_MYXXD|nr:MULTISPECIES: methyl-accepting chemotaxis protein [Myxococcus]ABF92699.1 methyl-accepting chemotaxis protein (MCP) signaling domain [Myxococcus xanthus DK 1622]NOJ52027.1 chemotaxis protein [Myxococcus xanthus]QPM82879.1 chemotaxis protein [Myxococcus xanthus]QVW65185.1 chemotaxis protein [Myxococcus xanthus DZ2]UEO01747.1 chemotaxis protein [Myxococcus xanthus DZ2]